MVSLKPPANLTPDAPVTIPLARLLGILAAIAMGGLVSGMAYERIVTHENSEGHPELTRRVSAVERSIAVQTEILMRMERRGDNLEALVLRLHGMDGAR